MIQYTETEMALIKAVAANPADDLPRLMLCDELEANAGTVKCPHCNAGEGPHCFSVDHRNRCMRCGDDGYVPDGRVERAEFIRVQIEQAKAEVENDEYLKADIGHDYPDRAKLVRRIKELRHRERILWCQLAHAFSVGGSLNVALDWADAGQSPVHQWGLVRRGFVAEVRCRLADWIGGECVACRGSGRWHRSGVDGGQCDSCSGAGRTPRIGPQVVAAHPVERVLLTDHNPYHNGAGYSWFTPNRRRMSSAVPADATIPENLFLALEKWLRLTTTGNLLSGERYRSYATREYAGEALSAVLIAHAKGRISADIAQPEVIRQSSG